MHTKSLLGFLAVALLTAGCEYWDRLYPEPEPCEVYVDRCGHEVVDCGEGEDGDRRRHDREDRQDHERIPPRPGACDGDCACPEVWSPVCDADGNQYGNRCEARCAGAGPVVPCGDEPPGAGGAPGDCLCPDVWDPVCDAAGNQYGNRCEARCLGAGPVAPCDDSGR